MTKRETGENGGDRDMVEAVGIGVSNQCKRLMGGKTPPFKQAVNVQRYHYV